MPLLLSFLLHIFLFSPRPSLPLLYLSSLSSSFSLLAFLFLPLLSFSSLLTVSHPPYFPSNTNVLKYTETGTYTSCFSVLPHFVYYICVMILSDFHFFPVLVITLFHFTVSLVSLRLIPLHHCHCFALYEIHDSMLIHCVYWFGTSGLFLGIETARL